MDAEIRTCAVCSAPLPSQAQGRPRKYCPGCVEAGRTQKRRPPTPEQRERKQAAERAKYAGDSVFRERQLAARRERYAANIERERDRSQRYYDKNRERVLARHRSARTNRNAPKEAPR
jgi:hypothetical protein